MFYGALLWRFIGTIVRWIFKGFKGGFGEAWRGKPNLTSAEQATYEFASVIIGFSTFMTLALSYALFGMKMYKLLLK